MCNKILYDLLPAQGFSWIVILFACAFLCAACFFFIVLKRDGPSPASPIGVSGSVCSLAFAVIALITLPEVPSVCSQTFKTHVGEATSPLYYSEEANTAKITKLAGDCVQSDLKDFQVYKGVTIDGTEQDLYLLKATGAPTNLSKGDTVSYVKVHLYSTIEAFEDYDSLDKDVIEALSNMCFVTEVNGKKVLPNVPKNTRLIHDYWPLFGYIGTEVTYNPVVQNPEEGETEASTK